MIRETTYDSLKEDWSAADVFTNYVYGPVKFEFGYSVPGLNEGIAMMKEGGKALLVLPSDKAFYDFHPMSYEIELLRVIPDPVEYEDSVLAAYLDAKGFDAGTEYVDNGDTIWFKETVTPDPGDEKTIDQGDTVLFRFKGRLVDGFGNVLQDERIFDSNMDDDNPVKIVFSSTPSKKSGNILAIPRGLVMALDSMRNGTQATAVLPYTQAFDDGGITSSTYGYTIVPPYQTVIYDIIVEDIQSPAGK
jgi:FKBP-type peptidyl-prolyl cis-trans isomerase